MATSTGFHPFNYALAPLYGTTRPGAVELSNIRGAADEYRPGWEAAWWDQPRVVFNETGQIYNPNAPGWMTPSMPSWADPAMIANPQAFYTRYQSLTPEQRADQALSFQDAADTRALQEGRIEAGRTAITDQQGNIDTSHQEWIDNPDRAAILEELRRRSTPEFELIGGAEEATHYDTLRRSYADAAAAASTSAAARGAGGAGTTISREAGLQQIAAVGGRQIRASIDVANQQARDANLRALNEYIADQSRVELAYESAKSQLAGALAELELGIQYEPTDYTAWGALADATQRADEEAEDREEQLRLFEESLTTGPIDWLNLALNAIGSGGPEVLAGLVGA